MTTRHELEGLPDDQVLWTRRREVLQGAAAVLAAGATGNAWARGNIVTLIGEARLNGARLSLNDTIQTGDTVETGPGSMLVFTVGSSAFHLRQNTRMSLQRGRTLNLVSALRLLTGALVSVWGRGDTRQIATPALTIGIRGTGVYTEARPDGRTYFCNCYGTVDLSAGRSRLTSQADYHQSFWAEPDLPLDRRLRPAQAINHTDEELEFLAALIRQRTRWEELGRKGVKDGKGYMEQRAPEAHPAEKMKPR